ncbi:MAG: hypothetical protein DLM67_25970 [Candidatus Nephthysia bennettiae]|nr:MAG: hypothetical protein DLM67_25970 [Candidatus Dormibacteraeota bacterium]
MVARNAEAAHELAEWQEGLRGKADRRPEVRQECCDFDPARWSLLTTRRIHIASHFGVPATQP